LLPFGNGNKQAENMLAHKRMKSANDFRYDENNENTHY